VENDVPNQSRNEQINAKDLSIKISRETRIVFSFFRKGFF